LWLVILLLSLVMNFRDAIVSSTQTLGEDVGIESTTLYPRNIGSYTHEHESYCVRLSDNGVSFTYVILVGVVEMRERIYQ
jgi:hypothetical protein